MPWKGGGGRKLQFSALGHLIDVSNFFMGKDNSCRQKIRTDSVQNVCGGVWQGFDHLTKLERSKVEVVLQGGLRSSSIL